MNIIIYDWKNGNTLLAHNLGYTQGQKIENASMVEIVNITKDILMSGLNIMVYQNKNETRICISDDGFGQL